MPRTLPVMLAIFIITLAASCDKDSNDVAEEAILYGTWVKGSNAGDTLWFYKRGGKNYMKSNQSFNPAMYAPVEYEYLIQNGKPVLKYISPGGIGMFPLDSFNWKVRGSKFEVQGFQIYMFMSSTLTTFSFTKTL